MSSSSLPNGGLSSVGASLLSTGQAPNPVPTAAAPSPDTLSSYQAQYLSLQAYDNQELLYASFLPQSEALANADSVFLQAAALLGSPGSPGTLATGASPTISSTQTSATTPTSSNSSTSSASSAFNNLPSVGSILAASDDEAQQTLNAYANAPVGSSILDYQA
ncbi:MAG: hypothetical protein ABSH03_04645 [Candidatus Lustribacter sp.]